MSETRYFDIHPDEIRSHPDGMVGLIQSKLKPGEEVLFTADAPYDLLPGRHIIRVFVGSP